MICTNFNNNTCHHKKAGGYCGRAPGLCEYQQFPVANSGQVFSSHKDGDKLIAELEASVDEANKMRRLHKFQKAMAADQAEQGVKNYIWSEVERICRYGNAAEVAKLLEVLRDE